MITMDSDKKNPQTNPSIESVKVILPPEEMVVDALAPQVCQKSNGTIEMNKSESFTSTEMASLVEVMSNKSSVTNAVTEALAEREQNAAPPGSCNTEASVVQNQNPLNNSENVNNLADAEDEVGKSLADATQQLPSLGTDKDMQQPEIEMNVAFETEIVVEETVSSQDVLRLSAEQDDTNNLLNDLDQNIEFNEVLCSSDISGNIENNNCAKQEVFNKEELLDILEGNDEEPALMSDNTLNQQDEVQIALQQLSRLQTKKKNKIASAESTHKKENKRKLVRMQVKVGKGDKAPLAKINKLKNLTIKRLTKKSQTAITSPEPKPDVVACIKTESDKNDSIVHKLVEDWDEEETVLQDTDETTDISVKTSESAIPMDIAVISASNNSELKVDEEENIATDVSASENQNQDANKSGDESQPQRRLGRVIKKKIIFDPDNPDTFTKGKSTTKVNKEPQQEPPVKKGKMEAAIRPKSKSPVSKLQWKKPTPKGNKQNKRLTEVDKLLMDEGAVNMIYQLTPEAAKGKKNVRTKAEFIKKLQSSTPESSEMKFRERKKELKEEEAKKILGGKPRTSLSSSVKSMSVCEDFETHSADDSIIYRRHSSSSYSSSCMSPRRMSDFEGNVGVTQGASKTVSKNSQETIPLKSVPEKSSDVFTPGKKTENNPKIIDKGDCLSIKQKLNSKLSQALNKRKREILKTDKPTKIQKVKESPNKNKPFDYVGFKYLNVKIDHRLAEITITHTGKKTIAVLKEIEAALLYVSNKSDVSVTLLTSVCGTLCSNLNLQPLLDDNIETRTNAAHELAEAVRLLLLAALQHSKLLVTCAWGACAGVALALLALSDVALAGESAELALAPQGSTAPQPGAAALAARAPLLVPELVVWERRLGAREAAAGGLVARALPDAAHAARRIAVQLAEKRPPTIQLKKKLLSLKNTGTSEAALLASLEAERDLFVEYWTSVEGQEMIRAQSHANNK